MYIKNYQTPSGFENIIMKSDGEYLTGLWFVNSKDAKKHKENFEEKDLPIFSLVSKWLDIYFSGEELKFMPKYKLEQTPFREQVTKLMNEIPYGSVVTYNDLAKKIARTKGIKKMSAQAVGGAVGYNPICIIIPCRRVIGANGNLVGYSGGLENKYKLLELEKMI